MAYIENIEQLSGPFGAAPARGDLRCDTQVVFAPVDPAEVGERPAAWLTAAA